MGLIYGIGFPPFLGGALRHADQIGMQNLCAMAEKYKDLGPSYEPTAGMLAMAENNERFY